LSATLAQVCFYNTTQRVIFHELQQHLTLIAMLKVLAKHAYWIQFD